MDDPAVGPDGPTQLVAVPKALVSGAPEKSSLPKGIDSKGPLYASVPQEKFEDVAYWVGYSEAAQAFALHEPSEPRAPADSDRAQTSLCTALTKPPVECAQPTLGFAKEHPGLLSKRNRFTGRTAEPTKTTQPRRTLRALARHRPLQCRKWAQPPVAFAKHRPPRSCTPGLLLWTLCTFAFPQNRRRQRSRPRTTAFSQNRPIRSCTLGLLHWTRCTFAFSQNRQRQRSRPQTKAFSQNRRRQMSRPRTTAFSQNWRRHGSRPLMAAFSLNRRRPRPRPRSFAKH